ncbi:MAG: AAA family ATPase, partial [Saprospiraceae bacterium]|nr:AAA family ATPase [Saprospiraceae bacterium]
MKNLPIGIQSFIELRNFNAVYVDKTPLIHKLVMQGKYYFLSRPRRFGKSLLLSTMKELFKGNKALFDGLWIENNWDWSKTNPVVHIPFDAVEYRKRSLEEGLEIALKNCAKENKIKLKTEGYKLQFKELLERLNKKYGRVVLLIDEYDKPILDYLETQKMNQAKANRDTLRDFYSILKSSEEHLRFVFITGISKFSKVFLFSHLNNLEDITLGSDFATIAGYTQEEIELNFVEQIQSVQENLQMSRAELLTMMKDWYNGYSWDGKARVYNPFGALNFFKKREFQNYWMATGNPRFLIEQMRLQEFYGIENLSINSIVFEKFDLENIELISLLFQTGYLTIKERDPRPSHYILDYPNLEVRESMYQFLMDDLAKNVYRADTGKTMLNIKEALLKRDLGLVRRILEGILQDLPPEVFQKQTEGLYHGLVHIVFSYLGIFIQSEVSSSRGYADAVVQTPTDIYVFEFKFNKTATEAINQIYTKNYSGKYSLSN